MKVCPVRYDYCFHCSINEKDITKQIFTIQYLREIQCPISRSSWGIRRPILTYICSECGGENL